MPCITLYINNNVNVTHLAFYERYVPGRGGRGVILFALGPRWERRGSSSMEQTIFMICMFFGVTAVALIAFTLLAIVLGKVKV